MNLRELHAKRRGQFWGEILPYLGYVIQSGVAVVFLFVLIAFAAWYTSILQNVPPDLPIRWIMLVVLVPIVINSSVRTYLRIADTVFLLPQESRMNTYFRSGWISGVIYKIIGLGIVLLTLWPLYIRSDIAPRPLLATFAVLTVLKLLSSYGSWREQLMVSRIAAASYRALRWLVPTLAFAAWLWYPTGKALIFMALIAVTYYAALSVPVRHRVAWERLIAVERRQASRVMMVLSWFVNVPQREQRVHARRWLSGWGKGLPWRKETAYRYLLIKSLTRSDILGILIRIGVLGAVLVWITREGLTSVIVYLISLMIIGLQLSSLRKLHPESFWLHVYPLPAGTRRENEGKLIFQVQLFWALLLWLPLLPGIISAPVQVLGTGVAGVALVFLFRWNADRKFRRKDDEDEE
ncbi:ABC transporter permease [Paenibacillus sp. JCM 10914]|uniref:ABC transporter permease n=1 Tax=Paenibacillus sp. JCM 10914 TaxID=1236974 RepID=UPI0003CC45D4|nr:ABC transporter permease [Paenibacillus sp. JCM 10914]GAE07253.1 ABC transporter, permease protein EscB [Paenibacillus sp. JCM 10914]